MSQQIKTSLKPAHTLKVIHYAQLKFSAILALSEPEFAKLIEEIEKDPIFQKLMHPSDFGLKVILRRPFPHSKLSKRFYELKDGILQNSTGLDVEKLLNQQQEVLKLIKKIGQEKFEKYFLYREESASGESIAKWCEISLEEVLSIQSFILTFSIHSQIFNPSSLPPQGRIAYTPIAQIELDNNKDLVISYLFPHLASGRYIINRERLEEIKRFFAPEERKVLAELLKKIEWVNLKQGTLQRILSDLILRQEAFLRSGETVKLLSFPQRSAAKAIGVAPSTVSRAIFGRSVILPWGEEKALGDLFVSRKEAIQKRLKEILNSELKPDRKLSGEKLRKLLETRYRMKIPLRTVNFYRREIRHEK